MRLFRIAAITITVLLILGTVPIAAEEEAEEKGTTLRVFYDKGFRLGSPEDAFSLRINGLMQVRYSSVDYDPTTRFNDREYSNFYVRRARLYFSGHAADSRFTYLLHIQLEPNQGLNANDMWLEYQFSDLLRLGAGRNKISYGLEFMNSGSALGMIDREVGSRSSSARFDWPIHKNRQFDQGEEAARSSVLGFIQRKLEQLQCQGLILLGAGCEGRLALSQLDCAQIVRTVSTAEILSNPLLKRQAWRDLQPAFRSA